ncbi:MAG: GNAT family N-acetyltransferase [Clostridia bacterium]|nr:GNAT family N-acetyltransferase [Clostridia bacterium]
MLKFKKFTENSIKRVQKYTKNSPYLVCDLSGGVLFMWNGHYNLSYAEYNNTLILKSNFKEKQTAFFLPMGNDFEGALLQIENYCAQNDTPLTFMCVEEEYLPFLKERYGEIESSFHRNWSDYVYNYSDIVTFAGKKFSGQRNHINAFKKTYEYKFKKLTLKDIPKIKEFLKEYRKEHKGGGKIERREYQNTLRLLDNYNKGSFIGAYIEIDNKICSFTIGEYAGKTLIIHVEKALRSYRGIYPTTFQEFTRFCELNGVIYVNREDDSGDLGLRTSKTQYHPVIILNKHFVTVKSPLNVEKIPTLKGERVVLSKIKKEHKNDYFKLSVSKSLNKYWGYDYTKDISVATPDAFFNMQKSDFKRKACLSLAILEKTSKAFMGEIVLHHFGYDNSVEIGVRLLKKFQGKGFAKESLSIIIDYIEKVLQKTAVAKCYLKNQKSLSALTSVGLTITHKDKKFYYLKKL